MVGYGIIILVVIVFFASMLGAIAGYKIKQLCEHIQDGRKAKNEKETSTV